MKFDKLQVSASLTFLTCSAALGLSWLYSHRELNQLGSQVLPFSPEATLLHRTKIVIAVLTIPYVVGCSVLAFIPIKRFSRRFLYALLIATTLVAVGLGIIVVAM